MKKQTIMIIAAGLIIGAISVLLVHNGNPANMGFCVACFLRDIVGALGFHRAAAVQYVRPEIIGMVLGAFVMALAGKEFNARGGSSPATRFVLGFCVMVGALMFLGCPTRMVLRMAGGDLNAFVGLAGFVCGILGGVFFLQRGFTLKKSQSQGKVEGKWMIIFVIGLFIMLVFAPTLLLFSESGPGSMHAPVWMALGGGLIVGALCQKTRLCMVGGIRDAFLFKDFYLLWGFIALFAATLAGNLLLNKFNLSFEGQPIAFNDGLWNFLGMALTGLAAALLGGCPMRQLILAGSGNSDSAVTVLGLMAGAAFCHNFGLASSAAGPTLNGKIAVIIGFAVTLAIGYFNTAKEGV